jgi:hypothetical protein
MWTGRGILQPHTSSMLSCGLNFAWLEPMDVSRASVIKVLAWHWGCDCSEGSKWDRGPTMDPAMVSEYLVSLSVFPLTLILSALNLQYNHWSIVMPRKINIKRSWVWSRILSLISKIYKGNVSTRYNYIWEAMWERILEMLCILNIAQTMHKDHQ